MAVLVAGEWGVVYDSNFDKFKTLTDYEKDVYNIVFDHSGRLATVCFDEETRLYGNGFNLKKTTTGAGIQPFFITFSPDDPKIAVGYFEVPDVELFSGKNLKLLYKAKLDSMSEKGRFD